MRNFAPIGVSKISLKKTLLHFKTGLLNRNIIISQKTSLGILLWFDRRYGGRFLLITFKYLNYSSKISRFFYSSIKYIYTFRLKKYLQWLKRKLYIMLIY